MRLTPVFCAAVLLSLTPIIRATTLSPGAPLITLTPTAADDPSLTGTIIAQRQSGYFATEILNPKDGISTFSGVIDNWVVRESGSGTLDFYFQFQPTSGPPPTFVDLRGFTGHSLDAGFIATGVSPPSTMSAGAATPEEGGYVRFDILHSQATVFLRTDAQTLGADGSADFLWTQASASTPIFSAGSGTGSIPEPVTSLLFLTAVGALALCRRTVA